MLLGSIGGSCMLKKLALFSSLILLSQIAHSDSVSGVVSSVGCHNIDNTCWVEIQGAPSARFCNNSTQLRWDASTSFGARWYATFLAAQFAGKRVFLELHSSLCGPNGYPTFLYGSVSD